MPGPVVAVVVSSMAASMAAVVAAVDASIGATTGGRRSGGRRVEVGRGSAGLQGASTAGVGQAPGAVGQGRRARGASCPADRTAGRGARAQGRSVQGAAEVGLGAWAARGRRVAARRRWAQGLRARKAGSRPGAWAPGGVGAGCSLAAQEREGEGKKRRGRRRERTVAPATNNYARSSKCNVGDGQAARQLSRGGKRH